MEKTLHEILAEESYVKYGINIYEELYGEAEKRGIFEQGDKLLLKKVYDCAIDERIPTDSHSPFNWFIHTNTGLTDSSIAQFKKQYRERE